MWPPRPASKSGAARRSPGACPPFGPQPRERETLTATAPRSSPGRRHDPLRAGAPCSLSSRDLADACPWPKTSSIPVASARHVGSGLKPPGGDHHVIMHSRAELDERGRSALRSRQDGHANTSTSSAPRHPHHLRGLSKAGEMTSKPSSRGESKHLARCRGRRAPLGDQDPDRRTAGVTMRAILASAAPSARASR